MSSLAPKPDVMHRHINRLFRRVFRPNRRFHHVSAPYHPFGFGISVRNAALTQSVHCLRPVVGWLTPVTGTKSRVSPLRCQTQTPAHPLHRVPTPPVPRSLQGESCLNIPPRGYAPHPVRPHQEGGLVSAPSAVPPDIALLIGGRNASPLQSPFRRPFVIATPLRLACRCHSPRLAMSLPSGTPCFNKCSLFPSCRG